MSWFSKNGIRSRVPGSQLLSLGSRLIGTGGCPIGVDMGDDAVKLVQLVNNGKGISLIAGGIKNRPAEVKPGSGSWQRWAIEVIRELTANGKFRGREVSAAIPASEVFIDHIKRPNSESESNVGNAMLSRLKKKLPFDSDNAVIKYIQMEENNVLVMAAEREKLDRHLAIYEKSQMGIKTISVWPLALINSYVHFFGRRKSDIEATVMLVDMEANCTNIVICRHKNPLLALSVPMGAKQLENTDERDEITARLVLELSGCKRQFGSMYRKARIERLIFLSGQRVDRDICATIAKQLEMPAQMGDCLAAVEIENPYSVGIDRREGHFSWATAFGLSLSTKT